MTDSHDQCSLSATNCPICLTESQEAYIHPEGILMRCPSCSHCFFNQRTLEQEIYSEEYFIKTHKNWFQNPNYRLFKSLARSVTDYGKGARVLDVGCGRGDFLIYLRKTDPTLQLTGIDLAPIPPSESICFITRDIFLLDLPETFDVIVSLAVIEHVSDVRKFLDKLKSFGHPGSTIAIMTLNESGWIYLVAKVLRALGFSGAFNRLYSKHHLHHYTYQSLRQLFEHAGLRIISHRTHNFPLAAVDFPSTNPWVDRIRLCGVAFLFFLGRLGNRAFLQTIVCKI